MREGIRGFWILLEGHVALYVLRGMAAYVCEGLLALHRVRVGAHTHTSIQRREHGDRKRCHQHGHNRGCRGCQGWAVCLRVRERCSGDAVGTFALKGYFKGEVSNLCARRRCQRLVTCRKGAL